jgi:Holliday junction resolvase YEN1
MAPFSCSGWFYRASSRHGHTKNPELAELFGRCARLLSLPFFPVFVFDGPERPVQKRNKTVRGTQHWLARDTQEMLECFGIPWVNVGRSSHYFHAVFLICLQARGEAEAELAWMSREGLIDAVLTDDSDIFVFGASTILRV